MGEHHSERNLGKMVAQSPSLLECILSTNLKTFCRSNLIYNTVVNIDAVIKFRIDNDEEIVCTIEDSCTTRSKRRIYPTRVGQKDQVKQTTRTEFLTSSRNVEHGNVNDDEPCVKIEPVPEIVSEPEPESESYLDSVPEDNKKEIGSPPSPDGKLSINPKIDHSYSGSCNNDHPNKPLLTAERNDVSPKTKTEDSICETAQLEEKPKHSCSVCGKVYVKPNRLAIHERTHTGERPYSCLKCGTTFRSGACQSAHEKKGCIDRRKKGALERIAELPKCPNVEEEKVPVSRSKRIECQYCGRKFSKPSRLVTHERTHSGERPFKCSMCGRGYVSMQSLRSHGVKGCEDKRKIGRTQIMKPPPQHPCSYCGKVYPKRNRMLIHERTKHTGERPFLCATCGKSFASKMTFNQHSLIHTKEKSFVCTVCDTKFRLPYALKVHMRLHTGERPHVCWHCGRTFRQYGSFQVHLRTHTKEKPLKCKTCDQRFAHRSLLQKHMMMHLGERQFKCKQCEKKFWTAHELKTHEKTHLGIRKHVCTHCNMRFTQTSSLKRHMEGHSGNNKVHHCLVCGKSFTRAHQVTIHMKVHLTDSPYRCQVCGMNFKSISSRKVHMQSHQEQTLMSDSADQIVPPLTISLLPPQPPQPASELHIDLQQNKMNSNLAYNPQITLQEHQAHNPLQSHDLGFSSQTGHSGTYPPTISQAINHITEQSMFHHGM